MTKTTNYQLPQWETNDPVKREDFNEAMEKIEEGLSESFSIGYRPYVIGTFAVPYSAETGAVVLTLGFAPHHILVAGGAMGIIRQGGTVMLYTDPYSSTPATRYVVLKLTENQVTFEGRGSGVTSNVTVTYIAYR